MQGDPAAVFTCGFIPAASKCFCLLGILSSAGKQEQGQSYIWDIGVPLALGSAEVGGGGIILQCFAQPCLFFPALLEEGKGLFCCAGML